MGREEDELDAALRGDTAADHIGYSRVAAGVMVLVIIAALYGLVSLYASVGAPS